ncbi:helix-turn-helix domain-containing protein [Mycobacterium riyadhense]|uniref:PucR family transcriptional regulator n=1 Tax=Mycobacterium riyadhense TaxID=486698 RepID=A0A1X2AYV9_9MYCO|nr:helix-turn-helix domain-containing protein [Mycobacterium riyadhense]MCV7149634.1 helix-turn-helix domain-containing protein [Mycobacterium riyadhense]ORW56551.1 PucR family transcriptional regulator [Mycobacterium riyadhense]
MAAPINYCVAPSIDTGGLTIQQLLDEPLMSSARVLAGADQLDRELTWMLPLKEVPLRPDSLDAVALYARPEALLADRATLTAVAARGATMLVVDGRIPADIPRSGLPGGLVVVEMPFPVGFAALSRLVADRTLSQELEAMRYSTHAYAALAGLFHRGAGLQMLIREVSNLSRNPAMALNARGLVVAHSGLAADAVTVLSDSVRRMLATGVPAARRSSEHDIRVDPVAGPRASEWTCIASAIQFGKACQGWVVVLVPYPSVGSQELVRHRIVTEQATAVIGSEMLRQRSVDEAKERARGDFIQALVHGSFSSEHELRARADHHEIEIDSPFGVFVAHGVLPHPVGNPAGGMIRLARYAANISSQSAARTDATVIGDVVVVVRTLGDGDAAAQEREMADFAQAMYRELEQRCRSAVAVGYGQPSHGAGKVSESYRQARIALGIARRLGRRCAISYQDLRSFTVLTEIADTESSRQLVREVIEPLRSGPNLLETLTGYLAHGGNVTEAARALNVHRNTLLTKLDRISQTIGLDIREPENQFTLWLAIRLNLLAEVTAAADREARFR